MYSRFLRWATDRLKQDGIVAFVSNSSFIEARTFDGFRKVIAAEFDQIYILDLKGNANTSGERRKREGGNAFNDQIKVGVSIYFLVRTKKTRKKADTAEILYHAVPDFWRSSEKLQWLATTKLEDIDFERIRPDDKHNWLGQAEHDWDSFLPVADKQTKQAKGLGKEQAIFKLYSLGVVTSRDEWVYDNNSNFLSKKVKYLVEYYNNQIGSSYSSDNEIKWSRSIKRSLAKSIVLDFKKDKIFRSLYRPFQIAYLYYDENLNEM